MLIYKNMNYFYQGMRPSFKYLIAIFFSIFVFCKLYYWLFTYPNADEAYYWLWGRNPTLSYHDHPALQAWVQGLFYALFGKSLFILRLPAFICSLCITYFYYLILKKLDVKTRDITCVILIILSTPIFFMFLSFAWQDYLMITLCLGSSFFWLNYLCDRWKGLKGRNQDILLAFLFLGLAGLSKYNSVFIALGVAIIVVSKRRLHPVLKDPRVYLGIVLCAMMISPIFIWNMQNEYGSFQFTLVDRTIEKLSRDNLFRGNYGGFILGSIIIVSPLIWVGIAGSLRKPETISGDYYLVFKKLAVIIFIITTVTFLFMSFFSLVLYYWTLPAYLLILPLAASYLSRKKRIAVTLAYSAIINIGIVVHLGIIPLTSFFSGTEDPDGAHHYGWREIGSRVEERINASPVDVQLFTSSYRSGSLLSFELDRTDIMSYAYRFDQFDYWKQGLIFDVKSALILTDDRFPMSNELVVLTENKLVLDTIRIEKWGYPVKEYYLYSAEIKDEFQETPFTDQYPDLR